MGELVPIAKDSDAPFHEAAAEVYLDLLNRLPRVRMRDVVEEMQSRWPDYRPYKQSALLGRLQSKAFAEYLAERRKEHIQQTLAARLYAAEVGSRLGELALKELEDRLHRDPDSIKAQDLLAIADRMVAWSEKVCGQVAESEEGAQPRVEGNSFTQILMNVPPERAEAMAAELARRAIAESRKS